MRRPGALRLASTPVAVGAGLLLLYLWIHTSNVPPEEADVLSPDFIASRVNPLADILDFDTSIAAYRMTNEEIDFFVVWYQAPT